MNDDAALRYLSFAADLEDPAAVAAHDEMPLWSAMFGLLLLKHVPLIASGAVLDIGCGTGVPLLELAQRCGPACRAYGVDMWRQALLRADAKRQAYGLDFASVSVADAARLPFRDEQFDLVVSNLGVNNFADPAAAFIEGARMLKRGGVFAITTNLRGHMREFYDTLADTLHALRDDRALEALATHIDHRVTLDDVRRAYASSGLAVSRVEQETGVMRFADGTALLNAYFIKLGFLGAWKELVAPERRHETFRALEARLNEAAAPQGGLELTIPMAYVEGRRGP